jgi:hypothetical protein
VTKYRFRIRTRNGLVLEQLNIQGRDRADAERKLFQMYPNAEVLECLEVVAIPERQEGVDLSSVLSLISRQHDDGKH